MNLNFRSENFQLKDSVYTSPKNKHILWIAPILMVLARPFFALAAQAILIMVYTAQGNLAPLQASTSWWTVYGTGIDFGCILLLLWLLKYEGIRFIDLVSYRKEKFIVDIFLGIGLCALIFPIAMFIGSTTASFLIYGQFQPILPEGALIRYLPLWGVIYSRTIWWVIWSLTEEITFQGYCLPRLQKVFGRTWMAVIWVSFGWSLQHSFLPFININHAAWLFLTFFPLTVAMQLLYLRIRRLTPLIVAHWLMDLGSVIFMVTTR